MDLLPKNGWFVSVRGILRNRVAQSIFLLFVIVTGTCFVHDSFRQKEAASLLHDLQQLTPGISSVQDVERFAVKHHLGVATFSPSRSTGSLRPPVRCFSTLVKSDEALSYTSNLADKFIGFKASWFQKMGLKPWDVGVRIELKDDVLNSYSIYIMTTHSDVRHPYDGWVWNQVGTQMVAQEDFANYVTETDKAAFRRHPAFISHPVSGIFLTTITPRATLDEINRAFSFDLGCLTRKPCRAWGDSLPYAWKSFCEEEVRYGTPGTGRYIGIQRECLRTD